MAASTLSSPQAAANGESQAAAAMSPMRFLRNERAKLPLLLLYRHRPPVPILLRSSVTPPRRLPVEPARRDRQNSAVVSRPPAYFRMRCHARPARRSEHCESFEHWLRSSPSPDWHGLKYVNR